jgi:hypothetical protein
MILSQGERAVDDLPEHDEALRKNRRDPIEAWRERSADLNNANRPALELSPGRQ